MKRFAPLLVPLVVVAVTGLYFGRFIDNFFAFDDFKYLENMYRSFTDVTIGYGSLRLISNLSWWPLFQLSGTDPVGYNLLSIILFAANGILLYQLLVRLFPERSYAFLATAFFVCSSAGVDAVFWKATNSSVISLFFYLSSLICYVEYRTRGERSRYVAAIVLFLCAMFSKEEAASLPFTAALIDIMFFSGWKEKKSLLRRLLPFCAIVVFYVGANAFVFNYLLGGKAEPEKLFRFRPLYSIIGGGTVFFAGPDGFIDVRSPAVYATCILIPLSFLIKGPRRLLLFGYLWIFLVFLPQSLTGLGQLQPRVIVNSISRYLYITSIGSSIVFAAVAGGLRSLLPQRIWQTACGVLLVAFAVFHFQRVERRGEEWRGYGDAVREFMADMKQAVPAFPSPSHVHVVNGPTGRAFLQQSLRAFYGNPRITWVDDPERAVIPPGEPLFVVLYRVAPEAPVQIMRLQ